MLTQFKIAVLQCCPQNGLFQKNTETVIGWMEYAAGQNAELLLVPECFLTGYGMLPIRQKEALEERNDYIRQLCAAAGDLGIGVVATAFTKGTKRPRNSAYMIDRNGQVLMKYDKVHTCDFSDEACLEHGTQFRVCDFHGVKIGIMICYDREYPESARILMLKGAEIILVPNDCGSMKPRVQALSTRAYENMTAVVMANPPGENAGCSCAFSPICWDREGNCVDNTLFLAGEKDEGVFFAEIDMGTLRAYRKTEMMGNTFRRVEAYQALLDLAVREPFLREKDSQI